MEYKAGRMKAEELTNIIRDCKNKSVTVITLVGLHVFDITVKRTIVKHAIIMKNLHFMHIRYYIIQKIILVIVLMQMQSIKIYLTQPFY